MLEAPLFRGLKEEELAAFLFGEPGCLRTFAGGDVVFRLWNATEDERLAETEVSVCRDGCRLLVPAGSEVVLRPGESLTLFPRCYHQFTVRAGGGPALIGEVSMCNDDNTDNRFYEPLGRFPAIEEDEPPYRLLCSEYPPAP